MTELPNFSLIMPEIFVLAMGCLVLLVDVVQKKKNSLLTYSLVQFTIVIAAYLSYQQFGTETIVGFNQLFVLDNFGILLKEFIYLTTFVSFVFARKFVAETEMPYGEYYILGLFSMLGMMILVSANHFLTLFLGLELMSLPIYAMVALRRDTPICTEAAMKYFVVGSLASGMLLYGLSMLYGATQTLVIPEVAMKIAALPAEQNLILVFGLVFIVAGVIFKLGGVPFHMWVPDVYQGAPSPVVLLIGSAAKIASLGLLIRLLVEAMPSLHVQWQDMLIVVSVLSLALGNLVAIAQTNLKRMLGYSSMSHVGFILLGIIAGSSTGYAASTFYMITYAIMTLGAFGLITMMSKSGIEVEEIEDFKGLNSRNPWLAFIMLILMFSMAGVPPFIGFMAKVAVLESIIRIHLEWLAVVAILFSIVGAYYYIRVIKVMYFEEPEDQSAFTYTRDTQIAISISGLAVLYLGLFPGALLDLCQKVF